MSDIFARIIEFIKALYPAENPVPLHAPRFSGNEKKYLIECIESTYVSYVGGFVSKFEDMLKKYTGANHAIVAANGTLALHMALLAIGVERDEEVLTHAFTFVATVNAISHCGARPVFIDCDKETLGMSPEKLHEFLLKRTTIRDESCFNKETGRKISACVPVHVFGHPAKIDKIREVCDNYHVALIEDAAESLGSIYKDKHCGTFGELGVLSFNGNKIVTTGGGGAILTDHEELAKTIRHLTATAKIPHRWEYRHDEIGYNYRMPNVNAAIGCAQMENLSSFIKNKRDLAAIYENFFNGLNVRFFHEKEFCQSNYWLNAIFMDNKEQRDEFLKYSNNNGVMARPAWTLMNKLDMYRNCQSTDLENAQWLEDRIVNIPSSVRI